ncbi:hypothetical protein [Flavobacterium sp. ABG]|jgi:hypothetical protein|uniref:hypothetical protein n=1 Tax=Flavobacterium sp. ABG TaxID=1423322 RepID=UPI00064A5218|nr:hypothetical protein [Flavobacterium sp. ABG]KLT67912.1 hypothetical protein AB674_19985 [Flavobacterium sp. ABG]
MAIFTPTQLIAYTHRLELQKDLLSLGTVFSAKEKEDLNDIYDKLLTICYQAIAREKEVIDPTLL